MLKYRGNLNCKKMEDDVIKKVYEDLAKYHTEISEHNTKLITSFGKTATKHFKDLLDFCDVTDKIELVENPKGDKQHESYGMFKNVYVEQWSTGMEGDSYAGYIYANVKGQWIKIPYSC